MTQRDWSVRCLPAVTWRGLTHLLARY